MEEKKRYCSNCGVELTQEAIFCMHCGARDAFLDVKVEEERHSKRNLTLIITLIFLILSMGLNAYFFTQINTLETWRLGIRGEINIRFGWGTDCQMFVTPDDPLVRNTVYSITGRWGAEVGVNERWEDYKKLYDWVRNNIESNYDSPLPIIPNIGGALSWVSEFWRFPNETINDGCGDCEDMALLLASMILCYTDESYACWVIEWTASSAHMAVALPVSGEKLAILDPAGNFYTRTFLGSLTSKDTSTAIEEWFQHWSEYPDIYVSMIFSNTIYKTFSDTEEFLLWSNTQYSEVSFKN